MAQSTEITQIIRFLEDEGYTETNADVDTGRSRTYRVDSDSVLVFYNNPVFSQAQCRSFNTYNQVELFFYPAEDDEY